MDPMAPGRSPSSRVLDVLIVVGIVALVVSIVLPSLKRMRESGGKRPCPSNLRQIGQAIYIYAKEHGGGRFPDSLDQLVAAGPLSARQLICPSSGDRPAAGGTPEEVAAAVRAGGHLSYVYVGAGLTFQMESDVVVAFDRLGNHGEGGGHVLYADGHVDWVHGSRMRYVEEEVAAGRLPVRLNGASATSQPATK